MVLFTHQFCHVVESEDELIDQVFPNMQQHILDEKWLCERSILALKNETVVKINKKILGEIASETSVYNSIDTVMSSDDTTSYPVEFLNSLDLSGVPSHKLELKVGVPVLLMRNLDAPRLCNGTRLRITELGRHIVKATILTGKAKGDNVLIPRIPIIPNNLPFNFKRLKFPLKVVFSMTINKSQGQTLKVAGIHLGTPCFSHGQLYVACSRVCKLQNLHVYAERKNRLT
ncbi:ATP-dependent DNA helicase [Trichonephila clavipes]|uniref:ATP-dependent DNA helicase n=1 Tax=Trichonephila clavipes TaxID=2585209 RepID=A0A8X6SDR6_TRICX|nr:ATP-dependent DNA helicase [Trichonephila clavipes]